MSQRFAQGTTHSGRKNGKRVYPFSLFVCALAMLSSAVLLMAQAGRKPALSTAGGVLVNVIAKRDDNSGKSITSKQLSVYDNGTEQTIRNLTPDPSPARIVLLV